MVAAETCHSKIGDFFFLFIEENLEFGSYAVVKGSRIHAGHMNI